MKKIVNKVFAISVFFVSISAFAGTFRVDPYHAGETQLNVGKYIRDLVPNSFISDFPYNKYAIFVYYAHYRVNDHNFCVATSGLTKRVHNPNLNNVFPYYVFSSIHESGYIGVMDSNQRKDCLIKAIRLSVSDMMTDPEKLKKDIPHL